MAQFIESLHHSMADIVNLLALFIEIWGVSLIILTVVKEIYRTVVDYRFDFHRVSVDETMNHGLASALEILLAAEILKTLTITSYTQLIHIAALVFIRIFIGLILHWEMKQKSAHLKIEEQKLHIEKRKDELK